MRILLFGLPGSGKTTLATALIEHLSYTIHLNADTVRTQFNDWDFSPEGRTRQAHRMRTLADASIAENNIRYAIADFIAPTVELRAIYDADFAIWMDTIEKGRFEDTNKAWQVPTPEEYHVRITEFRSINEEALHLCNLIQKHQQG